MHFHTLSLFTLLPFTMGIQTIYLGYYENSAEDTWFAWFSDTATPKVCTQGTVFGHHYAGNFDYCNKPITILGHTNITFTGCDPKNPASLPTGVSDGGKPALKCKPATTPPGGYPCAANGGVGIVEVVEYCK